LQKLERGREGGRGVERGKEILREGLESEWEREGDSER